MTNFEYGKIIHALDLARNRLAINGTTLDEADRRIRELVNMALRVDDSRTAELLAHSFDDGVRQPANRS